MNFAKLRRVSALVSLSAAFAVFVNFNFTRAQTSMQTHDAGATQTDDKKSNDKKDRKRQRDKQDQNVTPVTIPVTAQLREAKSSSEIQSIPNFVVVEDGAPQQILSVRGANRAPLSLAVLVQDDLAQSVANEINGLADFIRRQPPGTRVFVGYIRAGSLQVRQKFTTDLDHAARSLRIPIGSPTAAPFNPYVELTEALKRFDSQPNGRRAALIISDGLDTSRGTDSASITQSPDLLRSISDAQKRGVAVYGIYTPTAGGAGNANFLQNLAQGALNRLCNETGGRAFFQGTGAPVSFDPFLRNISTDLSRQLAITYLSTNLTKGFHRIDIKTLDADESKGVKILHPTGYER